LYERFSWIPAFAGKTDGESWDDELPDEGQPGFEMRDLPVLNHCLIKKAVLKVDYFGQQWVMGYGKKLGNAEVIRFSGSQRLYVVLVGLFRHSGEGRNPGEIMDEESPDEGKCTCSLNTGRCSLYLCSVVV